MVIGEPGWVLDLGLCLSLHNVYGLLWTESWSPYTINDIRRINIGDGEFLIYLQVFALLATCASFAGSIVFREKQLSTKDETGPLHEHRIEEALLPPLLLTSRTSHSRIFPKKHAFSYSYLFVGVPVGMHGRVANVLSVDSQRAGWFNVRAADYLNKGDSDSDLSRKLKHYLHGKGITDRDYSFAYLVTAPRFLGYSFNPVSFWYIYDSDAHLKYMVLEVNNTFDERRMYLLKSDNSESDHDHQDRPSGTLHFTDTWQKDFHVSPFNSRKGSYSLRAIDPLAAFQETGHVKIDNTIVLRSSKDNAKLVARVYSESAPVKPDQITAWQLIRFIAGWWWVGLATFPRIVWEAQRLFFKRKLHVWYRPEVVRTSIGRAYTDDESILESVFRDFLTHAVEHSQKALRVIYEPAHYQGDEIVLYSPGFTYEEAHSSTLTIKVLSPAFFSRFIHYAHAKEAFDRECLATDDKNKTVVIEGAQALPVLLDSFKSMAQSAESAESQMNLLRRAKWALLRRARCPPAAASYASDDESRLDEEYIIHDIRAFHFSELDRYAQQDRDVSDAYTRIATKLFLAERFAFGIPIALTVLDWILRSSMIVAAMRYADVSNTWDILRARPLHREDFLISGVALLLSNSIHIWSFLKG